MSLAAVRNRIQSSSLWIYRALTWAVLVTGFVFAAAILGLRYWILPDIGAHREGIAQRLSAAAQQKITIGGLSANWNGLRPAFSASERFIPDMHCTAAVGNTVASSVICVQPAVRPKRSLTCCRKLLSKFIPTKS